MAKTKAIASLCTALALLILSGCGFQLAGTAPAVESLDGLFVDSRVSIQRLIDQPLAKQLQNDFESLSPEVSNKARSGIPGIIILDEENIERGLSLTQGLFERQVELEKRIQYQIVDESGNLLAADAISASRELIEDPNAPAAKHREREILFEAINRDISRQLIQRFSLELAKASQATNPAHTNPAQ